MCQAFSCLITQDGKGYYDNKIHSHSEIQAMFVEQDPMLKDDKLPPTFARVEIVPENRSILFPDKWILKVDENEVPKWFKKRHEEKAWSMHAEWLQWLHAEIDTSRFSKNPFSRKPHLSKLKEPAKAFVWDSLLDSIRESLLPSMGEFIWESVRDSLRDSRLDSVRESIWKPVRAFMRESVGVSTRVFVRDSIEDFMWAQVSYMFPKCSLFVDGKYKYQDLIDLWNAGIVPAYYAGKWHYFVSPNGDGVVEEAFGV